MNTSSLLLRITKLLKQLQPTVPIDELSPKPLDRKAMLDFLTKVQEQVGEGSAYMGRLASGDYAGATPRFLAEAQPLSVISRALYSRAKDWQAHAAGAIGSISAIPLLNSGNAETSKFAAVKSCIIKRAAEEYETNTLEIPLSAGAATAAGYRAVRSAKRPLDDLRATLATYRQIRDNPGAIGEGKYRPQVGDIVLYSPTSVATEGYWDTPWSGAPEQSHTSVLVPKSEPPGRSKPKWFQPATVEFGKEPSGYVGVPKTRALMRAVRQANRQGISKLLSIDGWKQLYSNYQKSLHLMNLRNARSVLPTPDNVLKGIETQNVSRLEQELFAKDPTNIFHVYRRKDPLTKDEIASIYRNLPAGSGVTIGGNQEEYLVAGAKNVFGLKHHPQRPLTCSGGVCAVLKDLPGIPKVEDVPLPKDLRNLPGYELVARSAMPEGMAKQTLKSGLRMAGLRSIPTLALAGSAGVAGLNTMSAINERNREMQRMGRDIASRLKEEAAQRRWFML